MKGTAWLYCIQMGGTGVDMRIQSQADWSALRPAAPSAALQQSAEQLQCRPLG